MKIFIKNMVCSRCEMAVSKIFIDLGIETTAIHLGEVETANSLNKDELSSLNTELKKIGFEILEDTAHQQIELIKKNIIQEIAKLDIPENFILSEFISDKMHKDYSAISKLFSQNENITLEQFYILQKIEKIHENRQRVG